MPLVAETEICLDQLRMVGTSWTPRKCWAVSFRKRGNQQPGNHKCGGAVWYTQGAVDRDKKPKEGIGIWASMSLLDIGRQKGKCRRLEGEQSKIIKTKGKRKTCVS